MIKNPQLKDSFSKTIKVIRSCRSRKQLEGAINMVNNFKSLYLNVGYTKILNYKLKMELNNKKQQL